MPGSSPVLGQGQTVALLIAGAGVALLLLALALEARSRPASARTRTRSALVGALLVIAGLALMLVRRIDPAALSRVLAVMAALMPAAAAAERGTRWAAAPGRPQFRYGRPVGLLPTDPSPHRLPEELS